MSDKNIAKEYDYQMGLSDKQFKEICDKIRADERLRIKTSLEKIISEDDGYMIFIRNIKKSDWDKFWREI